MTNSSLTATLETMETRRIDLWLAFVVTFIPPTAAALGLVMAWTGQLVPTPTHLLTMLGLHAVSLLGVEMGFHRLFAHRAFKAGRGLKIFLAVAGSFAFQGPPLWWASIHRKHHQHSDQPGDPHSMYLSDPQRRLTLRGILHAHIGWIWTARSIGRGGFANRAKDLYQDKDLLWIHMRYPLFLSASLVLPPLVFGLLQGAQSALLAFIWISLARVFFANHLTYWCINSVTHGVGTRAYDTPDRSTNVGALTFFTFGQSWHNNHHAYPASAVMNHQRWQLDPGAWCLAVWEKCGWATNVIRPPLDVLDRKRNSRKAPLT